MLENLSVQKLDSTHSVLVSNFSCVETAGSLYGIKSKERRNIVKRSGELDAFLKKESFPDQEANLNTTHLFIDESVNKLVGFVSLCNDSIPLSLDEKNSYEGISYETVPALKIARLGVSNEFHRHGYGALIVQYCVYVALKLRERSGIAFITLDCYPHRKSFYARFGFVVNNAVEENKVNCRAPISMRLHINTFLKHLT